MHALFPRIKNDPVGSAPPVKGGLALVEHTEALLVCDTALDDTQRIKIVCVGEFFKAGGPHSHARV